MWWPTPAGVGVLLLVGLGPVVCWGLLGETFLRQTQRRPGHVLVVEGWIGHEGVKAAKQEFDAQGYDFVFAVGPHTNNRWGSQQWSYASLAHAVLGRTGLPMNRVIEVPVPDVPADRTYHSAVAVGEALRRQGIDRGTVVVFTLGVHARRSRLVFERGLGSRYNVGVVAWTPGGENSEPWWRSSERARDFLVESLAYFWELFFRSGRWLRG